MNILVVADEQAPAVYSKHIRTNFTNVDLVIGCGDLKPSYLDFIVSMLDVPCLYVPGNHDGDAEHTSYDTTVFEPSGGINIDNRVLRHQGLIFGGLGGSPWYNGGSHQYSDRLMKLRVLRLLPQILWHRSQNGYGLDVLVTHAPPRGVNDGIGAHAGFPALRWLIERFPPRYMLHGHVHHNYRMNARVETQVGDTLVINCSGYRYLTIGRVAARAVHR